MSNASALKDEKSWKLRSIKWGQVWRRQDHANLILTGAFIVAVIIVTYVVEPRNDAWFIYDATISNPVVSIHGFNPSVPNWVAVVIPLLCLILTLVLGEFIYSKRQHHSITDAVAVLIYFFLDALQSFLCALVVVQATKVAVGRLRPDFLARCNPIPPQTVSIQFGENTNSLYPCTNTDSGVIKDGKQSFPSGHSAFSFNIAIYASAYLIWCWNMRREWVPRNRGPKAEFLSDLWNVVAKIWMLCMLAVAWGISCSRIVDNQHHPSDVVAGMLLGIVVAVIYILRAVPRYTRVLTPMFSAVDQEPKREVVIDVDRASTV